MQASFMINKKSYKTMNHLVSKLVAQEAASEKLLEKL